tara:strand:+ start:1466 stop:2230 length:765 start_codon:yes stop_codon:yes gene_type:complete
MDVIILAGGLGTRLSEYTSSTPKPMVTVGGKPLLLHIMEIYKKYNYSNFYIAMGYKAEVILKYFIGEEYKNIKSEDRLIKVSEFTSSFKNNGLNVNLVFTGENTMTGGRIKRMENYVSSENFMVTYGDGLSSINIDDLSKFHKKYDKIGTMTAVRPPARFGELELEAERVTSFKEKPQLQKGWINGGFFIFKNEFFNFIKNDQIMLEREPLEKLVRLNELNAFKHDGFWQCMDNKRDRDLLEKLYLEKEIPWIN